MVPSQEENGNNLGIFFFDFLHNNCMLSVLIRIASMIGVRAIEVRLYKAGDFERVYANSEPIIIYRH